MIFPSFGRVNAIGQVLNADRPIIINCIFYGKLKIRYRQPGWQLSGIERRQAIEDLNRNFCNRQLKMHRKWKNRHAQFLATSVQNFG
jgi:hypothetical protein